MAVVGIDGELDVAAAGFDADLADDGDGGVAHALIFLIGQRLGRCHRDRVAGMDAHRVEVLDGADDDDVVRPVAHHLQLKFLPADDRFLDQDFVGRAEVETMGNQFVELLAVVGDAAARAAEREAGAEHARQADALANVLGFGERAGDAARGYVDADLEHGGLELLPILRLVDHLRAGADHLDLVLLENAVMVEVHGGV